MPLRSVLFVLFLSFISACASRPGISSRKFNQHIVESPVFGQAFTGFALYDTRKDEMVYEYQADKYYTPASNTKIFTLYASLKILGDSIPALQYKVQGDSLIFTGTGDPTLLHPDISSIDTSYQQQVYQFLHNAPQQLFYAERPSKDKYFGPGWAWSDYNYYYSTEKSSFPVYANLVRFQFKKNLPKPLAYPGYFTQFINGFADDQLHPNYISRSQHDNSFSYASKPDTMAFTRDVPFKPSPGMVQALLSDTLKRLVNPYEGPAEGFKQTRYSLPADSVYKRMMHDSDNFFAEQLLLLCSSQLQDTLSSDSVIAFVQRTYLQDLPDEPQWVDGSGLSRYNMQTPRSMVALLRKVSEELDDDAIREIFPAGGQSGTVKSWYKNPEGAPYVYAKTGTLGGKMALSGYLFTKKVDKLIFSFLLNNYITSSSIFKKEIEKVLWDIYQHY